MKDSVSIIGAGSWGTTLAVYLAKKGIKIYLHGLFQDHNLDMIQHKENRFFLKGVQFPSSLFVEPSLEKALKQEIILIAIPVKFIRKALRGVARCKVCLKDKIFISVSKGIETGSLRRVSEIIREELELPSNKVAVLSGPTIAKEVAEGIPTAAVIASKDRQIGIKLQKLFNSQSFRVYLHNDMIGVELGGALKNIIALSCGISDGLSFGTNTKSALITRGLVEITRIGRVLGADPKTFWGISGLGDLMTTCFSPYSRNRIAGETIGKGKKLKKELGKTDMVAEGIETVKAAYKLGKKFKVSMPITEQVYSVLYRNKLPYKAVIDLMSRPLKEEKIN